MLSQVNISEVLIDSEKILVSKSAKNLGVILDSNLNMNQAVASVRRSCYLELRKISNIRHILTEETVKMLVLACVISKLDYCNSLFYNITEENMTKLQQVQNHAARLIMKKKKRDSATPLLKHLHWLPISVRADFKICTITYQCLNDPDYPQYLKDLVTPYQPTRSLRSTNKNQIVQPRTRLSRFGDRAFTLSSPLLWNALPEDIKCAESLESFKSKLKTFLFVKSFDQH